MGFAIFFLMTWLISALFVVISKKLTLIENTFVFLIVLVININFSWVIMEELNLIKVTNNGVEYTAFLLDRSILIPMLLIAQLNFVLRVNTVLKKILITALSVVIMVVIGFLSSYFDITELKNWNHLYGAIYYLILHPIAYYSYKLMRHVEKNVVKYT